MEVEREFAAISVPFAIGISSGLLFSGFEPLAAGVSLCLAAVFLGLLAFGSGPTLRFAPPILFLFIGLFCACTDSMTYVRPSFSLVSGFATRTCASFKDFIDSLGFSHPTTAPMIKALLTGDRTDLSRDITLTFRSSGASHILALSGLHLGVIYLIMKRGLAILGNSITARRVRAVLLICASGFYTLMTGAGPSLVRAFLFILLNEAASLFGRKKDPTLILLTALTIQLALKPSVISSIGFQLSYLAICGIVFIFPLLRRIYPESRFDPFKKAWDTISLTVSCQLFTAPLSWAVFKSFPKYFILTNLLAMPLTSGAMFFSVLSIALSAAGICPAALLKATDYLIQALLFVLNVISGM